MLANRHLIHGVELWANSHVRPSEVAILRDRNLLDKELALVAGRLNLTSKHGYGGRLSSWICGQKECSDMKEVQIQSNS
jgi:hypothetical protein